MDRSTVTKINRESVSEIVYQDLRRRILVNGEFVPGDKLPSETELAKLFGVSRNSVRTALQKLCHLGLLDIRVGEGSFVKELSFTNLAEFGDMVALDMDMRRSMHEFRSGIERSCTELAILRMSAEELEDLERQARGLVEAAERGDVDGYVLRDHAFHNAVCKASHNKLYECVYANVQELFLTCIRENVEAFMREDPEGLVTGARNHLRLIQAIRSGEKKKALGLLSLIVVAPELKQQF